MDNMGIQNLLFLLHKILIMNVIIALLFMVIQRSLIVKEIK